MYIAVCKTQQKFGKLELTPTVANVGVSSASNRLCVIDRNTSQRLLVYTGAEISVLAASRVQKSKSTPNTCKLYAANNTPINTYGEKNLLLYLGLRRPFRWSFIVVDVKTSILGADFLRHYKLLVDLHRKKIIDRFDSVTELAINAVSVTTSQPSVHILSHDQVYHDVLQQYPDVLRSMSTMSPSKHNVTHHMTIGAPSAARKV
ncbi:uncharacterized protein LOC121727031 [Aricia agestis]|uniref:uncharacterized protein LOC121727031 n=1 Tax=Aricia agestis TaxID=91739 RepID=UPI001C206D1E|nr:uncharacterized protein LOC121727031 [Aricia agestis]